MVPPYPSPAQRAGFVAPKSGRPVTTHQFKVYDCCRQIPQGYFSTYMAIARAIGSSPRAVGGALRCNPFAPTIPCHRVLASDFFLGGFNSVWGNPRKRTLLENEGLVLTDDNHVSRDHRDARLFTKFAVDAPASDARPRHRAAWRKVRESGAPR